MLKLSVITINYNDADGLEKTIKSVVSQTVTDVEFIIIDGGSTDKSIDVIKKYPDRIDFWSSEKDKGIYDAQNKGIAKAKGEYFLFLNSGDSFFDKEIISKFYNFQKNHQKKIIYGNSNAIDADRSTHVLYPPEKLDFNFWYANTINHQAIFFHNELFRKYGNFSTGYKFAADFDFLFKIYVNQASEFIYFNELICNYDNTGLTSKYETHKILFMERKRILQAHTSKSDFCEMKNNYYKTISIKKKYTIIISENNFLKTILKPIYKIYNFFSK